MNYIHKLIKNSFLILLVAWSLILNCTTINRSSIERYNDFKIEPGFPETRYSVNNSIIDNQTYVNINLDIVKSSLKFKKEGNTFKSSIKIEINIFEENTDKHVFSTSTDTTIITKKYNPFYSDELLKKNNQYQLSSGKYIVKLSVLDYQSKKNTTVTEKITIPDIEESSIGLTDFTVLSFIKEESIFYPVTTYDIKKSDSIKVRFQLHNNISEQVTITTQLLTFKTDQSYPRPMTSVDFSSADIEYKGINYEESETIFSNRRVLETVSNITIESTFEDLNTGNYRFIVNLENAQGDTYREALDFGIKDSNYPSLVSPKNLIEPLSLLMNKKEFDKLVNIESEIELKKEVDRFWLENINNKSKARQVIELFYDRVEQANKLYSTFKEGWKTDRGMMYILFGPPYIEEKTRKSLRWFYSTDRYNPRTNFSFYEPQTEILYYGFDHYILNRSQQYHDVYYSQVQRWKKGFILNANSF